MPVDVVVVNYKTPDLLKDFSQSYEINKFPGCTITVVDVSPNETSRDLFGDHKRWISIPENVGYGRACNIGASLGRNDVILLANSDTRLTSDFEKCYDALVSHDDWGVLGPRQVDDNGHITFGGVFDSPQGAQQRGWLQLDRGQFNDVRDDALTVSGSLYFIKRSLWHMLARCPYFRQYQTSAGAFLETRHYYEETYCSYHARHHGYKCVYFGEACMVHLWHRSHEMGSVLDVEAPIARKLFLEACAAHHIDGSKA